MTQQNSLNRRELMFIEDEIRAEEITAKTLNWLAGSCEHPEFRSQLEQIAESHQRKIADLSQYFHRIGANHH